jgi:hypothetical protein
MFPFIIGGALCIGGGLVLLFRNGDEENTKNTDGPTSESKENIPRDINYDLDKVRQARRELRFQMRQKKKLSSTVAKKSPSDGEEE